MKSLTINSSTTPFLRAGRSNAIWPIVAVAGFLLINAGALPPASQFAVSAFVLVTIGLGVRMYITTVARVVFLDDSIEVLRSVDKQHLRYDSIESVELTRLRLTPLLRVRIKSRLSPIKLQFVIPGPMTQWGTLEDCSAKLKLLCEARGLVVTAA